MRLGTVLREVPTPPQPLWSQPLPVLLVPHGARRTVIRQYWFDLKTKGAGRYGPKSDGVSGLPEVPLQGPDPSFSDVH